MTNYDHCVRGEALDRWAEDRMMLPTSHKDVYSPDEFAELLGVPPTTVRRWLREGRIRGRKIGRRWFVPHSELEKTINPPDPEPTNEVGK